MGITALEIQRYNRSHQNAVQDASMFVKVIEFKIALLELITS